MKKITLLSILALTFTSFACSDDNNSSSKSASKGIDDYCANEVHDYFIGQTGQLDTNKYNKYGSTMTNTCVNYINDVPVCQNDIMNYFSCTYDNKDKIKELEDEYKQSEEYKAYENYRDSMMNGNGEYDYDTANQLYETAQLKREEIMSKMPCTDATFRLCITKNQDNFESHCQSFINNSTSYTGQAVEHGFSLFDCIDVIWMLLSNEE